MISNEEEATEAVRKILGAKEKNDRTKSKKSSEQPIRSVPIQRPIPIFAQNSGPQPMQKVQPVPMATPGAVHPMAINLSALPTYPSATTNVSPQYQQTLTYATLEQSSHPAHQVSPTYTCQYLDYSNYEYSDAEGLEKALGLDFSERTQRQIEFLSS